MLGVRLSESSGFQKSASDNVLIASDGSGGSRETPKAVRQVAFGVATFSSQRPPSRCVPVSWEARCQADKRFKEPSFGELSKS